MMLLLISVHNSEIAMSSRGNTISVIPFSKPFLIPHDSSNQIQNRSIRSLIFFIALQPIILSMTTNPPNSIILASIPDSHLALQKKRASREYINDKLFDLERQIADKCKGFSKQITIEPLKAQRRFTQDFFGNSEPLTPVSNKTMSIAHAYDIQILDGNTTCETRINQEEREERPSALFSSAFTSALNLNNLNSISPESIMEEKPILELNIERYSNSLSEKEDLNHSNHSEELKKLGEEEERAKEDIKRIEEEILALKRQPTINLAELTIKKLKHQGDVFSPDTAAKTQVNFSPRDHRQLSQNLRFNEEKLYVYQRIFTRIYNIIHKNPLLEEQPGTVDEIKTRRYLRVEEDLKAMFGTISVLHTDIQKYEDIKKNMHKQVLELDLKVRDLVKRISDLETQEKSLISQRSFKCQFEISTCKDMEGVRADLCQEVKEKVRELNNLYDLKIKEKYKEMIEIKMEKENMVNETLRSEHNEESRKKVEVTHEITEVDAPVEENQYVKRVYTRKTKTTRNVQILSCPHPQLHPSDSTRDRLVNQLIAANTNN